MPIPTFMLALWLVLGASPPPVPHPKGGDAAGEALRRAGLGAGRPAGGADGKGTRAEAESEAGEAPDGEAPGTKAAREGTGGAQDTDGAGAAARWQRLDALFADRDREGALDVLEKELQAALAEDPRSFEALWRLSRVRYWVADNAPQKETKKRLGREGWALGDRAAEVRPDRGEGHYYAAINIGSYGAGAGVWAAITEGLEGAFKKRIQRAIAIDPWLDRGGPLIALGRFHASMPWPKTDRKQARQLYDRVLEKFPQNLRALHYRSQLEQAEGKRVEASRDVQRVQRGGGEDPPEDRRVQGWSRRVARELSGGR